MNEAWASLIQTAVWLTFVAILLWIARGRLSDLLQALVDRVLAGAEVNVGFVRVGTPPASLPRTGTGTATSEGARGVAAPELVARKLLAKAYPQGVTDAVYLVHAAQLTRPRTAAGTPLYRVRLWVEADKQELLDDIVRITYRLHETFPEGQRTVATEARDSSFELWLTIYGEFSVTALAETRSGDPVWLQRYLDLPGRPPD